MICVIRNSSLMLLDLLTHFSLVVDSVKKPAILICNANQELDAPTPRRKSHVQS